MNTTNFRVFLNAAMWSVTHKTSVIVLVVNLAACASSGAAVDISLIEGKWGSGSESWYGSDFEIKNGKFALGECRDNPFKVIDTFESQKKMYPGGHWERKDDGEIRTFRSYVLQIDFDPHKNCPGDFYPIIRMDISSDLLCSAHVEFYDDFGELEKDRASGWSTDASSSSRYGTRDPDRGRKCRCRSQRARAASRNLKAPDCDE